MAVQTASKAKWTVLVYMAADTGESFYGRAMEDITEMTAAEFDPSQTKVVVYAAAPPPWVTKCWEVKGRGKAPELLFAEPQPHPLHGNTNFVGFVEKYAKEYRADYYLLVLWGHGEGIDWQQKVLGKTGVKRFGQGSQSAFEIGELGNVLSNVEFQKYLKVPIENIVVGFDACLMGMVEVYYQIKDHVGWVVAANDEIPDTGWPYTKILNKINGSKPADLATEIVNECTDWYSQKANESDVSFSACDLTKIDALKSAVAGLRESLEKHAAISGLRAIREARDYAVDYCEKAYIDLNAFCAELKRRIARLKQKRPTSEEQAALEGLEAAAQLVLDKIAHDSDPDPFLIAWRFSDEYPQKYTEDSRAVSICFPESEDLEGSIPGLQINWGSYEELKFSEDTGWPNLMRKFWAEPRVE